MKRLKPLAVPGRVVSYMDEHGVMRRRRITRELGHGQQLAFRRLEALAEWQAGHYAVARQVYVTRQQLRAARRKADRAETRPGRCRAAVTMLGNRAVRRTRAADARRETAAA